MEKRQQFGPVGRVNNSTYKVERNRGQTARRSVLFKLYRDVEGGVLGVLMKLPRKYRE